jgi:hypothetical protein
MLTIPARALKGILVFLGLILVPQFTHANVGFVSDPTYPSDARLFTTDPESYTPGARDVKDTRLLRQTFQLSRTTEINGIVLSLIANGTDGGIILKFYEVSDINANLWNPGKLVKTITVAAGVDIPSSSARLGLVLTGSDSFSLPKRNLKGQGYGVEISNANGTRIMELIDILQDHFIMKLMLRELPMI